MYAGIKHGQNSGAKLDLQDNQRADLSIVALSKGSVTAAVFTQNVLLVDFCPKLLIKILLFTTIGGP